MNVRTLPTGTVQVTHQTLGGTLVGDHYTTHRGRVWTITDQGTLVPAFGGLKLQRGEQLASAVRRGLNGERGTLVRTTLIVWAAGLVLTAVAALAYLGHAA
jgi:hypothetical protein